MRDASSDLIQNPNSTSGAKNKRRRRWPWVLFILVLFGFLLPERITLPVQGASVKDWNADTFWYEPWGSSGVHKGIDIFGHKGTPVLSSVDGLVVYTGDWAKGGKVLAVLGPKWRVHYYAHLARIDIRVGHWVSSGEPVALLGDSGNAQGKPPHLHYSILRIIPVPWAIDTATQGYLKSIYLDPGKYLSE